MYVTIAVSALFMLFACRWETNSAVVGLGRVQVPLSEP